MRTALFWVITQQEVLIFYQRFRTTMGWDSSVGIETGYGLDDPGIDSR
jgi:hypothetical protein